MRHVRMAAIAALGAGMVMAAPADAQREDFRWNGQVARGQTLEVHGISGDIDAEPASGDRVEVVGRFDGRDAGRLRVEVVQRAGRVIVCTVYPGTTGVGEGDHPCGQHRGNRRNNVNGTVNFRVRVPAGVRLVAATVSGDVHAERLRGAVQASTVSGDVRVETSESATASTVNGDMDVTLGSVGSGTSFSTVNGEITLRAGPNVNADVTATTVSGDIEGDFGVEDSRSRRPGSRSTRARIGRGGPRISISTVNGEIRLERAR